MYIHSSSAIVAATTLRFNVRMVTPGAVCTGGVTGRFEWQRMYLRRRVKCSLRERDPNVYACVGMFTARVIKLLRNQSMKPI